MVVDTTARAVLRMKPGHEPDLIDINGALSKGMKVKDLEKSQLERALEVYTVRVKGLG